MFGSFRSAWFEFRLKRSGDAPAGDCLQSLSGAALQQFFATAQARKAAEILLVSEVADQYLTLLSYDELVAVTQQTLDTAQKSYDLTLLQFHTGTGTELAVSQAQTVVEQARANYSAEVRGRAQAENALVLLLGQPLPADLPPAVPLNSQTLLADNQPDRRFRHSELIALGAVQIRFAGLELYSLDLRSNLQCGQPAGQPGRGEAAKGHRHRAVRKKRSRRRFAKWPTAWRRAALTTTRSPRWSVTR